jgi:S1-C subfamily serine protease
LARTECPVLEQDRKTFARSEPYRLWTFAVTLDGVRASPLGLAVLWIAGHRPTPVVRSYPHRHASLADYEKSTIEIFDRVSTSVVHIVGGGGGNEPSLSAPDEAQIRTGTGFIWDQAGNVVTNDHVVEGTNALAVRLVAGQAVKATTPDNVACLVHAIWSS